MEKGIRWFIEKELLLKTPFIRKLSMRFLEKAKNNLVTMSILFDLHKNDKAINLLHIPEDYDSSEWVVVCGYYAMYMAASAAVAKIGYKSKNHTATILALETFFVKKQLLEPEYLKMIEMSEIAIRKLPASARGKKAISEHAQEHAQCFSTGVLDKAELEKEHVEQLKLARDRREIAQYSVTKQTTRLLAEQIKADAYDFVDRMEKLIKDL